LGLVLESEGLRLAATLSRPATRPGTPVPAVLLCHGFPPGGHDRATVSLPELAERIVSDLGWAALVVALRGCGDSNGDFSLHGWLTDLLTAARHLHDDPEIGDVWIAGFGTGGALAICAAAREPWIRGVACLGTPADFDDWAGHPRRLVEHARELGLIRDHNYPPDLTAFSRPLREIQAVRCAAALSPRALLVVHGSDDDTVPVFDARVIADAHGSAELRLIPGAAHQLRYDPRAMAILLGWFDRQRGVQLSQPADTPSSP
jgi:putative redox protein